MKGNRKSPPPPPYRSFFRVLRFSPLLKNQHFQIPIRSWNARAFLNEFFELLGAPWVNKLHLHFFFTFFFSQGTSAQVTFRLDTQFFRGCVIFVEDESRTELAICGHPWDV